MILHDYARKNEKTYVSAYNCIHCLCQHNIFVWRQTHIFSFLFPFQTGVDQCEREWRERVRESELLTATEIENEQNNNKQWVCQNGQHGPRKMTFFLFSSYILSSHGDDGNKQKSNEHQKSEKNVKK